MLFVRTRLIKYRWRASDYTRVDDRQGGASMLSTAVHNPSQTTAMVLTSTNLRHPTYISSFITDLLQLHSPSSFETAFILLRPSSFILLKVENFHPSPGSITQDKWCLVPWEPFPGTQKANVSQGGDQGTYF